MKQTLKHAGSNPGKDTQVAAELRRKEAQRTHVEPYMGPAIGSDAIGILLQTPWTTFEAAAKQSRGGHGWRSQGATTEHCSAALWRPRRTGTQGKEPLIRLTDVVFSGFAERRGEEEGRGEERREAGKARRGGSERNGSTPLSNESHWFLRSNFSQIYIQSRQRGWVREKGARRGVRFQLLDRELSRSPGRANKGAESRRCLATAVADGGASEVGRRGCRPSGLLIGRWCSPRPG